MSYLLMQILICLLVAGLIGMIIGWLLRGDCKKALKDNDNQWENKLVDTNNAWEQKVQGLLSEHQENIQEADFKIVNLRETINRAKYKITMLEQKLQKANDDLAKANSTIILKDNEIKRLKMKVDSIENKLQSTKEDLENFKVIHQSKIKEWQMKLDKANQEHKQEKQSLLGNNQNKIKSLEQELDNSKEKINISQAKIATLVEELENTKKAYKLIQEELRLVRSKLSQKSIEEKELTQKLSFLEKELNQAKNKIIQLNHEKESIQEKFKLAENTISSLKDKDNEFDIINSLYECKKKYNSAKEQLDECKNDKSDINKTLTSEVQSLLINDISTIKNMEEEGEISKPTLLKEAKNGKKDNLTLVKGIGKVLEERLNDLGIFHFEQIASWTKKEQAWIDKYMSFPGRIEREEWVQQAKKLLKGIETEFAKRVKSGDVPTSKKE